MYSLYQQALSGCGDIGDTISGWIQEISDDLARSDYAQIRDQVYAENKDEIDKYESLGMTRW